MKSSYLFKDRASAISSTGVWSSINCKIFANINHQDSNSSNGHLSDIPCYPWLNTIIFMDTNYCLNSVHVAQGFKMSALFADRRRNAACDKRISVYPFATHTHRDSICTMYTYGTHFHDDTWNMLLRGHMTSSPPISQLSILVQAMICSLKSARHYLNKCWIFFSDVLW